MRVLLVDDHDGVRTALCHLIEGVLGHEVVGEVGDGATAVDLAASVGPDVAFIDVQMPGMSGPETAAAMHADLPELRIVALTAAADAATVAAMIASGADSYLVKTSPADELRKSLRRILDGEVVLAPMVLPGVVADLAQRLRDERDAAAAAAALDQAKLEFLSLVSDRMATPLTVIGGYAKTMTASWERLDDPLKLEFLDAIDRQAERLGARLAQILAVTRLQSQPAATAPPFALDLVAREVLDRHAERAAGRTSIVVAEPVLVAADRSAVWGVVDVLVHNALVHTPGVVTVRCRREGTHGVLEILDEGPGMAPEQLALHRCQPFSPGDTSDTSEMEGLGLSLYSAQRVLELCGGELRMTSAPTTGTSAAIVFPAPSA
jgi:two-component system, NarL family, response regulator DesR